MSSYVYAIQAGSDGPVKIGTSTDPRARLAALSTASAIPLELRALMIGDTVTERNIHRTLTGHRRHGEWFAPTEEVNTVISWMGLDEDWSTQPCKERHGTGHRGAASDLASPAAHERDVRSQDVSGLREATAPVGKDRRRGRPRIHLDNAAKQRAYRERKKLG